MNKNKKYSYYLVNPGGNVTALVYGKYPSEIRQKISQVLFKKHGKEIEQVGFFWNSRKPMSVCLAMAGDEFCGNAIRSLAFLYGKKNNLKNVSVILPGMKKQYLCVIGKNQSTLVIPKRDCVVLWNHYSNVCLPGISHTVAISKTFKTLTQTIKKILTTSSEPASGFMSAKYITNGMYELRPYVFVKKVKTFFQESACASGTVAVAVSLYEKTKKKTFRIVQPSGSIYSVKIDSKNNNVLLKGPIWSVSQDTI